MFTTAQQEPNLSPLQAAIILDIDPEKVRQLCRDGKIKGILGHRLWEISRPALNAYIQGNTLLPLSEVARILHTTIDTTQWAIRIKRLHAETVNGHPMVRRAEAHRFLAEIKAA